MMGDAPEITVLQLPKFKDEATRLIGADGIEAVALYLIDHPDAGDVIPAAGGARIIYLYVVIAARICSGVMRRALEQI
jgi:hypothetical protein